MGLKRKKHKFCPQCGWMMADIQKKMYELADHWGVSFDELNDEMDKVIGQNFDTNKKVGSD